jgi:hypothetical protein
MYTVNTSTFWGNVQSFFGLVGGAMRLDPAAFKVALLDMRAAPLILSILLLAGISVTLGQSVILFANKVTPRRFISSLLLGGALFVVGVVIWVAIFQLIGRFVFGERLPFLQMLNVISLADAPFLLGFFVLLPYLGSFLEYILDIWSFLTMLVALNVALGLNFMQALLCALLGWVIIEVLKYTIGRPFVALDRWLKRAVAGTSLSSNIEELVRVPGGNMMGENKGGLR